MSLQNKGYIDPFPEETKCERNFCICGFHREYIDVSAELLGVNIRVSNYLYGAPCIVVMSEISVRDNHFGAGVFKLVPNLSKLGEILDD